MKSQNFFFNLVIIAVTLLNTQQLHARNINNCERQPQFGEYKSSGKSPKKRSTKFEITGPGKRYETRIRNALDESTADLASKYNIVLVGCGTNCMKVFAVNSENGSTGELPAVFVRGNAEEEKIISTQKDSALVVYHEQPDGYSLGPPKKSETYYFKFTNGKLTPICKETSPNAYNISR